MSQEQDKINEKTSVLLKLAKQEDASRERLSIAQSKQGKELLKLREEVNKANKETREEIRLTNAAEGSLSRMRLEVKKLRQERDELNLETEEGSRALIEYNQRIDHLTQKIKENQDAQNRQRLDIGRYQLAAESLFPSLANISSKIEQLSQFDFTNLTESFAQASNSTNPLSVGFEKVLGGANKAKSGVIGLTRAAWAFIATPIGAIVTAFVAIAAAVGFASKAVFEYNKANLANRKLTEQLTGTFGELRQEIQANAKAIAEEFDENFTDVLQTANAIVKQTGEDWNATFDLIQDGFVRGANAGGDYLSQLREFAPVLNNFGFSVADVNALIIASQQNGVFNDRFIDSIKEAGVALSEFTASQRDALARAFGEEFATRISEGINEGTLSVKDALIEIKEEADDSLLSVQEQAQLTADIFKGVGEDIGGANKILTELYDALNSAPQAYTPLQQALAENATLQREVEQAKADALETDSVFAFEAGWRKMTLLISKWWYQGIALLRRGWEQWNKFLTSTIVGIISVFNNIPETFERVRKNLVEALISLGNSFVSLGKVIGNALKFDFTEAGNSFDELKSNVTSLGGDIKGIFADATSDIINSFNVGFETAGRAYDEAIKQAATAEKEIQKINNRLEKGYNADPAIKNLRELEDQLSSLQQAQKNATSEADFKAYAKRIKEVQKQIDRIQGSPQANATAKKQAEERKRLLEQQQKEAENQAKRLFAIEEKRLQNEIKLNKEELRLFNLLNKDKLDSLENLSFLGIAITKASVLARFQQEESILKKENDLERARLRNKGATLDELYTLQKKHENDIIELAQQRKEALEQIDEEIRKIQVTASENRLENFKFYNESEIDENTNLNQELIQAESDRLAKEKEMELNHLAFQLNIDRELTEDKIKNGEELNDKELEFAQKRREINEETAKIIGDLNEELSEQEKKRLDEKLEKERETAAAIGQILGNEAAAVRFYESVKQFQNAETQEGKVAAVSTASGAVADVLGRETATGKVAAAFEASINTYMAITKVLGQLGAFGPPVAVAIGALGFSQVRKILSTPTPQFEKGTKNAPKGWAITQEKGPEMITDRKGKIKTLGTKSGNTLTYLDKGDVVYTANETKSILSDFAFNEASKLSATQHFQDQPTSPIMPFSANYTTKVPEFDYSKFGKEVKNALKNNQTQHPIVIDGITYLVTVKNGSAHKKRIVVQDQQPRNQYTA